VARLKEEDKIILPIELQKQMLKFFMKTSIPRIKQEKINLLSEKNQMGEIHDEEKHE